MNRTLTFVMLYELLNEMLVYPIQQELPSLAEVTCTQCKPEVLGQVFQR